MHILENNIYGVDLNDESVEIAKLSLWLRTAQKGRKLNSLSNNIKCGNSLINDITIAGDKAFSWEKEFPEVFAKGGFEVIIGNPPYGAKFSKIEISYFLNQYNNQNYQLDSYLLFTEKLVSILKNNGFASYIMPNTWLSSLYAEKIRDFVLRNFTIVEINHYSYFVFEDATVETDTYIFRFDNKSKENVIKLNIIDKTNNSIFQSLNQKELISRNGKPINIYEKNEYKSIKNKVAKLPKLGDLVQIIQGTKPFQVGKGIPKQTNETLIHQPFVQSIKKDNSFKPLLRGSLINRYANFWNNDYWISYGDWLAEPRYSAKFESASKIVIRQTGDSIIATIDFDKFIARDNLYVLRDDHNKFEIRFLLCLLNSRFLTWYFRKFINPEEGKAMAQVKRGHLLELPIVLLKSSNQKTFNNIVDLMLSLNKDIQLLTQKFANYFSKQYKIEKLSGKLEKWYDLEFTDFVKELNKGIKAVGGLPLTKKDEFEWIDLFEENKQKALSIKSEIDKTDKEIDQMVYELYCLTEEEVKIVEGN